MPAIARSVVCVTVCVVVTTVSPANITELIEVLFGRVIQNRHGAMASTVERCVLGGDAGCHGTLQTIWLWYRPNCTLVGITGLNTNQQ